MKTYNCPYCKGIKLIRDKLVKHIDKKHFDDIPDGFTPYRIVYDIINNHPDHIGHCTICNNPTKWNEKRQKYERLCGNPKCYEEVKKIYQKRMIKVYNKTSLMDDPEHLEKMLAGRKISGKYKWSDGREFTYTGTYEKKFLEFLDKTMEFDSKDIICPGPILEYEFNGKKLKWITDFYLPIYNLIVEVKFGVGVGSYKPNPNNRPMPEYNAKTKAKEIMITNLGKYNYLRLTNNDFAEFMSLLAELKMNMKEDKHDLIYRIHENIQYEEENNLNDNMYIGQVQLIDKFENDIRDYINSYIIQNTPDILEFIPINKIINIYNSNSEEERLNFALYKVAPKYWMINLDFQNRIIKIYENLQKKINTIDSNIFNIDIISDPDTDQIKDGKLLIISKK